MNLSRFKISFMFFLTMSCSTTPLISETIDSKSSEAVCAPRSSASFANLPSKKTDTTIKIAALGSNEWLALGSPSPDPEHGSARGRAYTSKMAYASDLGGAFLFGEGVHGWWNRKTGFYMDDLWFYDSRAHRWIVAYPGFNVNDPPALSLDENGFSSDACGPLPVATNVHGYEQTTYDSRRKRFMHMPGPSLYFRTYIHSMAELEKSDKYRLQASPWMFDITDMKWYRVATEQTPRSKYGDILIYLHDRDETFFWRLQSAPLKTRVSFYNNAKGSWRFVDAAGPGVPFGIEATACYDPKGQRIFIGGGRYPVTPAGENPLRIYDLKTDTWIAPELEGDIGGIQTFMSNEAALHYDEASDQVLLFRYGVNNSADRDVARIGVYAYDPTTNIWSHVDTVFPWTEKNRQVNAFYDTHQNAHFFHFANDSDDNGEIYVYRYRR